MGLLIRAGSSRALLMLLLLVGLALTGCASHAHLHDVSAPLLHAAGPTEGLVQVGNGDWVLLGIYAFVGAVIVLGFVVDLILLPFSYDEPELFFPCCKALVKMVH